jgi:hypothetical protein
MPSAQYYIDQVRTLMTWAAAAKDKAYADALRRRAADLLANVDDAAVAVPDLNTILAEFNEGQMQGRNRGSE